MELWVRILYLLLLVHFLFDHKCGEGEKGGRLFFPLREPGTVKRYLQDMR
jgi:hypothetical protein